MLNSRFLITSLFLRSSWNDYFPTESFTIEKNGSLLRLNLEDVNIYIHNCFFYKLNSDNTGGAIYGNNYNINILIEDATFAGIHSEKSCGSIFIETSNHIHLNRVCGIHSTSKEENNFGLFEAAFGKNNTANLLSLNYCPGISGSMNSAKWYSGCQILKSLNFSNFNIKESGGIYSVNGNSLNLTYSLFQNLYVSGGKIFYHNSDLSIYSFCNFIDNNLDSSFSSNSIFYIDGGSLTISDCVFSGNINKDGSCFFYRYSGNLLVDNCFFDNFFKYDDVTILNNKTITSTILLTHYYSDSCFQDNLTPIPPTKTPFPTATIAPTMSPQPTSIPSNFGSVILYVIGLILAAAIVIGGYFGYTLYFTRISKEFSTFKEGLTI